MTVEPISFVLEDQRHQQLLGLKKSVSHLAWKMR